MKGDLRHVALMMFFLYLACVGAIGQEAVKPEDVGLSSSRLARIEHVFKAHIERGELPGAVVMIARRGQIAYFEAFGQMDLENHRPMRKDAIFRIASMTKMITSTAAMILYEQGLFMLHDPVSKFIPAFQHVGVAVDSAMTIQPAKNEITIRDLMRHTSGITYASGRHVVDGLYREAGLRNWDKSLAEFVETLARIPLAFQPGEEWEYGLSTDVLGFLIERVSEQSLDEFFREHIFEPLGMHDTGFFVPESKRSRLVHVYELKSGTLELLESARDTPLRKPPQAFSGGGGWASLGSDGGLASTAYDYMRLLQMLLNGGQLEGQRLLSRKTAELMMTDHLNGIKTWLGPGVGFGLCFAVLTDLGAFGELGSQGMVWWAGSDNTYFWIDNQEQMIGLLMMQVRPFGHLNLMDRFQQLALQSIVD